MKWFDLKAENSKLERVQAGPGRFALKLSIDTDRLGSLSIDQSEVERQGWIVDRSTSDDGPMVFLNHRLVQSARDVASSLVAFFPEASIKESFADLASLSQGEAVEGLRDRATAKPEDFEGEMQGVAQEDLHRIRASIVNAQRYAEALEEQAQRQPLGGLGFSFLQYMTERGEPELGAAAIYATVRDKMPKLEAIITGFANDDGDVVEKLRSLVHDARVERVRVFVAESRHQSEVMTGREGSRGDLSALYLRHRVPVLAMEPVSETSMSVDERRAAINMQVRSDKSLSEMEYAHALGAAHKSMIAVAQILNRSPDDLFPNQSGTVLRIARNATVTNDRSIAQARRMGHADDEIGAVQSVAFSANRGGAIIHELGHILHDAHGVSDAEMRGLLEETGVRVRVIRAVRAELEQDRLDPSEAEYLMSDPEIWARTMEATAVNRAIAAGDGALETIGGFTAAHPADHFSPIGDNDLTEAFARKVSKLLDEKLEALRQIQPLERMEP